MQFIKILLIVALLVLALAFFQLVTSGGWHKRQAFIELKRQNRKYITWRERMLTGRNNRSVFMSDEMYLLELSEQEFRKELVKIVRRRYPLCVEVESSRYGQYLQDCKSKGYTTTVEWEAPTLSTKVEYI